MKMRRNRYCIENEKELQGEFIRIVVNGKSVGIFSTRRKLDAVQNRNKDQYARFLTFGHGLASELPKQLFITNEYAPKSTKSP